MQERSYLWIGVCCVFLAGVLILLVGCTPRHATDLYPDTQEFQDWQRLEDLLDQLEREQQERLFEHTGWVIYAVY